MRSYEFLPESTTTGSVATVAVPLGHTIAPNLINKKTKTKGADRVRIHVQKNQR
jgi:hypothetical protein